MTGGWFIITILMIQLRPHYVCLPGTIFMGNIWEMWLQLSINMGTIGSVAMTIRSRIIRGTYAIYQAYFLGLCQGISPQFLWPKI